MQLDIGLYTSTNVRIDEDHVLCRRQASIDIHISKAVHPPSTKLYSAGDIATRVQGCMLSDQRSRIC